MDFLEQYSDGKGIFELVHGEIVQMEPTRAHKNVARYLVNSKYQASFKGSERIVSLTFPQLELTVEQILSASQMRKL